MEKIDLHPLPPIPYFQYLSPGGQTLDPECSFKWNAEQLKDLYYRLLLLRLFDQKAVALQRTGKLGTYPSSRGQEAVFVGTGLAMEKNDLYVPYYRDAGVLIQRGVPLETILMYWSGDERGNIFGESIQDFPFSVPVGSQGLHAAGAAFAMKYYGKKNAVVTMCGDGATSQGDFYEALNISGVWQLPVVFIICNNQWAISIPREQQSAASTLAQKAIAAGIHGEQVDGDDIFAVIARVQHALMNARERNLPSVIEILCYRQCDHTTADDAARYEDQTKRLQAWKQEPLNRLKEFLIKQSIWNEKFEKELQEKCEKIITQAVDGYLKKPQAPVEDIFNYLYENLPDLYQKQKMECMTFIKNGNE